MSDNTANSFPGPYVNKTNESDPIMKRINPNMMDIGARKAGMPGSIKNGMGLEHVGNAAGSKK